MLTRTTFWPEVRRAAAQWVGVVLAAILSGSLLAALAYAGVGEKMALGIAMSLGFVLALVFWVLIGRRLSVATVEYALAASPTLVQFEASEDAFLPTAAFAPVRVSWIQQSMPVISTCYAPVA